MHSDFFALRGNWTEEVVVTFIQRGNIEEGSIKKSNVIWIILIILPLATILRAAKELEKLATVKDIEEVTGMQGLKLVPRNPQIGAGGDLNFAGADGTLLLMVAIQDAPMYNLWKNQEGFFQASVSGIGDEAFEGPQFGNLRYILIFRKGEKAISLSSFFNMQAGGDPFLTQPQLREIAKIILKRL
jgi:hypothetical protein